MDSSSASSPFSTRSTDASSPEASSSGNNGDYKSNFEHLGFGYGNLGVMPMPGMHGIFNGYPHSPFAGYPNNQHNPNLIHNQLPQAHNHPHIHSQAHMRDIKPSQAELARSSTSVSRAGSKARGSAGDGLMSASGSVHGSHSHGGTRSEPPHRAMQVEGLAVVRTKTEELAGTSTMNRLLLQGDPQVISKQRVETAIRVIIDLLRHIPLSPTSPPLHPSLSPLILRDSSGNILTTLERIDTFRSLRLQHGTTTKTASKKQLQAGPTAVAELAYLETAVYMSGPGDLGKRVYACRRCRMREAKRRQSKDANKKIQPSSGSDDSIKNQMQSQNQGQGQEKVQENGVKSVMGLTGGTNPGQDYITGVNPEQYDPMRTTQEVEEPVWDPGSEDWRHEIVLFNSAPEVAIKDGSCNWLPFRVVCYGKCHGEKVGFRIRFTIRSHKGDVIATALTDPIRITDDHKTESKAKPKIEGMTSTNAKPTVARARKAGRQSAASSRRQSPAPSEAESVQSRSEAGAFLSKQTPQVRAGKPYERPPTQSPLTGTLPVDVFANMERPPSFRRQHSGTSIHSVASLSALPIHPTDTVNPMRMNGNEFPMFDAPAGRGTVSPGALRRPHFDFTTLDGMSSFPGSSTHSAASSNVASPISQHLGLTAENLLFTGEGNSPTDLMQALMFNNMPSSYSGHEMSQGQIRQLPRRAPMVSGFNDSDIEMSHAIDNSFDNIFDTSSHGSLASSFDGDADGNSLSTGIPDGSLFSDSGVVPDDMQGFLDFSGGEDQILSGPTFSPSPSPLVPFGNFSPISGVQDRDQVMDDVEYRQHSYSPYPPSMPPVPPPQLAPIPQPPINLNPPSIMTVIPAEGPVSGGTTVAIIGANFTPGLVIMFGDRPAKLQRVDATFIQCLSPPAVAAGMVQVGIQGIGSGMGMPPALFKYNMMDTDLMLLALQVRDQYQGSSSDAAYRLAHHVAARSRSTGGSDWSDPTGSSPSNYGPSPKDSASTPSRTEIQARLSTLPKQDLETTVLNYLASLDEDSPGSLRRSGAVNTPTESKQTLLHMAAVMGYQRLLRRLVFIGGHLDVQDVNGFTPLSLASLRGEVGCARVLVEAGAAYDRPTNFGELPLDLAKIGEQVDVEVLLLSAVWSTMPESDEAGLGGGDGKGGRRSGSVSVSELGGGSEIDDENPSSASDVEGLGGRRMGMTKPKKPIRRVKGTASVSASGASSRRGGSRPTSISPIPTVTKNEHPDDPPPYEAPPNTPMDESSWIIRALSSSLGLPLSPTHFKFPQPLTSTVLQHFPHLPPTLSSPLHSLFDKSTKGGVVPTWEGLIQRMTSPEEVLALTQAVVAATFNAVVQSGATSGVIVGEGEVGRRVGKRMENVVGSGGGGARRRDKGNSPGEKVVKHVKRDRMLYLFWLPILLFVGFWLMVTALPIATGFCLIYARQITRYIKQRV